MLSRETVVKKMPQKTFIFKNSKKYLIVVVKCYISSEYHIIFASVSIVNFEHVIGGWYATQFIDKIGMGPGLK